MAVPFYVSPEQVMKDRAEYARKGIARGRALVALEYADGVLFVGENPSRSLYKTSEIYDRLAFAAVGRYNEFEALRVSGIRLADVKGYQYGREDVTAKPLANAYSQALGAIFMGEGKPFEVEVLIAEVDAEHVTDGQGQDEAGGGSAELYHILYDGSIVDEHRFVAIGGQAEDLGRTLEDRYEDGMSLEQAVTLSVAVLAETSGREIPPADLEVSGLSRRATRRRFFRLDDDAISAVLSGSSG
ncbi:MAG TPA: proteasome subunit alpha [Nitriliruptorales bacterium]|nr:proteasome subunit alpha [Nitriliruptorales bacterium]